MNKVKLRGQKIPEINMARKVSFLRGHFLYSDKGTEEERKKLEREGKPSNPLLVHRVHLVNVPAPKAGASIPTETLWQNSRPGMCLPAKRKLSSAGVTTNFFKEDKLS